MQRVTHANGVITYTFDSLAGLPLRAHVSTRHGGVSPEPWRSLNFSVLRGDDPQRVRSNRTRLAEAAGIDAAAFVGCRQMHGTGVAKVDWSDAGTFKDECDALVTDTPGLPLFLVFADCVPVLLYDPRRHALGVCHAGWRGTVNGAAAATLWAMQAAYDTQPGTVRACIGPSIGPASYAVGDEVIALAHAKLPAADTLFHYPHGPNGQAYFDLWEANRSQLLALGVPSDSIEVAGIDTAANTDDFFSHRAERGRCGLFGMLAWLESLPAGGEA
jgi:YfiH family protein